MNFIAEMQILKRHKARLENTNAKVEAEVKRLREILRIGCYCNRGELEQWLKENKVVSDKPFEKESVIVLRMIVIEQALKKDRDDA